MWASRGRNKSAQGCGILYSYVEFQKSGSFLVKVLLPVIVLVFAIEDFQVENVRRHRLKHPKQIVLVEPHPPPRSQPFFQSSVGQND